MKRVVKRTLMSGPAHSRRGKLHHLLVRTGSYALISNMPPLVLCFRSYAFSNLASRQEIFPSHRGFLTLCFRDFNNSWIMLGLTRPQHMDRIQGRNEVGGHPGQEASLTPLWSKLRSFESKCAVLYWRMYLWHCCDFSVPGEVSFPR